MSCPDPEPILSVIAQPGLRHGPLDRLLRSAMREFVEQSRNDGSRPYDGLRAGVVDLVAAARDTDRPLLGAALMTLVVMEDAGPSAMRSGLYALLDAATRLGLDRHTVLPTAALTELADGGEYCPGHAKLHAVLADVLDGGIPFDVVLGWSPQQRAQAWLWASRMQARRARPVDVPARPEFVK